MADINPLELPKFGMTMEEGVVDSWLIAEGEAFTKGQPICTVESSKISNDLEAPFDGVLRRIVAEPGSELPVGALIGVSAEPSVSEAEIDAYVASRTGGAAAQAEPVAVAAAPAAPAAVAAPAAAPAAPAAAPAPSKPAPRGGLVIPESLRGVAQKDVFATPHAHLFAEEHGVDISRITGTGPNGRVSVADIETAIVSAGGSVPVKEPARSGKPVRSHADDSRIPATPIARRRAQELGLNLHDVRGSGPHNRVTKEDVEAAAIRLQLVADPREETTVSVVQAPEIVQEVEQIPLSSMRKVIGQRLQASVLNAPHFRVAQDLTLDKMLALRKQINAEVPGVKVSVNDLLIKAVALALIEVPEVNVQFDDQTQTITRFSHADVSVAVALESGLITPIVRNADVISVAEISSTVLDLVTRAKTGRLKPEEFQGGTFSISNLGMFGVPHFDAIINPPQAAILAVGAGRTVPVFDGGEVVARTIVTVTLSSDHRVIDGALAATFLKALKQVVESPARLLV